MPRSPDLTGQTFGRLRIVARSPAPSGVQLWLCSCECGGTAIGSTARLRKGDLKSCGCRHRELTAAKPRPVLDCACGDHSWAALTRGFVTLVSPCDRGVLETRAWSAKIDSRVPHCVYAGARAGRRQVKLHRLLMPGEPRIDHVSGNGCDNRRHNLRAATASENAMNSRGNTTRTSKYKGVSLRDGRWTARIQIHGVLHHLGQFGCATRAAVAYDKAAQTHFGRFARPNLLASRPINRSRP